MVVTYIHTYMHTLYTNEFRTRNTVKQSLNQTRGKVLGGDMADRFSCIKLN